MQDSFSCGLCGAPIERSNVRNNAYAYCPICDAESLLVRLSEEEEASLYSDQYYSTWAHDEKESVETLPYWGLKREYFSRLIHESGAVLPKGAKAMDIGCATGACLSVFLDLNLEPYGIDVNPYAIETSRKNVPNAQLFMGKFEDRPDDMNGFSMIIMSDVIEHAADPAGLLDSVNKSMCPGGQLILVTPNIDAASRKLMGPKWPHYKPEHGFLFGEKGLRDIISKAGFEITSIRPAVKILSLLYGLNYYKNYGGRYLSTMCKTIRTFVPDKVLNFSVSISIGEARVYATK